MNTQNKNSPTEKTKNKPYTFVQKEGDDFTCIKLLSEKYFTDEVLKKIDEYTKQKFTYGQDE